MIDILCITGLGTATTSRILNLFKDIKNINLLLPKNKEIKGIDNVEKNFKVYYYLNLLDIIKVLNKTKPKIFFSSLPLPITMFCAIYVKVMFKSKIIIDWDDWDDINKFKIYHRPLIYISLFLLRFVDKVIVVNKNLIKYGKRFVDKHKFIYIPNGVNTNLFDPKKIKNNIFKKYKINKKIVLFIGSLNNKNILKREIKIFQEKKIKDAVFVIIGYGRATKYIEKKIKRDDNILIIKNVKRKDIPKYIKFADICIVPLEDNFSARVRSPVKLKEFIAMEKCVLGTAIGELKNIYRGKGNLFRKDNSNEVEKINEFLNSKRKREMIEKYNKSIKNNFDYKKLSKKIKKIINQLSLK